MQVVKEEYAELIDWASKNLTDGEQSAFNEWLMLEILNKLNLLFKV